MKKALAWTGIGLICVVGLLLLAACTLYVVGGSKLNAVPELPEEALAISADSATLAHGDYLVRIHACRECHGEDLAGKVFADAPPFFVVASNLTSGRGGIGSRYTDTDWERAIRHGVRSDGRGMVIMPSELYYDLSDDEVAAMIAYLKSVPSVDNELPQTEIRPLGRIIAGTGGIYPVSAHIAHDQGHPANAPPHGATLEYGAYRTTTMCTYCHGQDLHGGPPIDPNAPPATDLYVVTAWTLDQFKKTMQTGATPNGRDLNPQFMPWTAFRHMTDAELEALYMYLNTLSPKTDDPADQES